MKFHKFFRAFAAMVESSPREELKSDSRYIFLSDLHMGDGGSADDLAHNRELVEAMLNHYLEQGFVLVLNGDIEDLGKFRYAEIRSAWSGLYAIFDLFAGLGALRKILGNHDMALQAIEHQPYELLHALVLERGTRKLVAFHGHQASGFFVKLNPLMDFALRYLAKPLKLKNSSISKDFRFRFKTEKRIYKASKKLGMVSVSGHTHRPLFESLSKYDSLRWAVEEQLREYAHAAPAHREEIAGLVKVYRMELKRLGKKDRKFSLSRSLYEKEDLMIPCVFNSGCATGKNGITAIEISGDSIRLVHWTKSHDTREYLEREALEKERLEGSECTRYVLRHDYLEQVFSRIELLGSPLIGC